jgi:predicted  nucleic acid-binding Zn-ribbon protein
MDVHNFDIFRAVLNNPAHHSRTIFCRKEIKHGKSGCALSAAMSWSWSNPTAEEAEEAYEYYKSKYQKAANQKRASERQEEAYIDQRNSAKSQLNSLSEQKELLEKRLEGVEDLIKAMEGTGGWFAADVPGAIEKAQQSLTKADSSFRSSMRLSGGAGAASLETAFQTKAVGADANSSAALAGFKAEKTKLEQEIAELTTQIANLSSLITSLTEKIKACNDTQSALRSSMNSYAYDMNHYKKYTY